jgi:probable F420-dependent oxidoreductase
MLDPFVALTAAAGATSRIRLGTAVCLVTQHDPINCAKAVATLDRISSGRFLFGIGAGWNEEEMRNHGTDPGSRFRLMRERVEAMRAIWTQEQPSYHGKLVDFDPIWSWPKPVQRPHPPVLIGGAGAGILKRVAAYGDGWLPVVAPALPPEMKGRMTSLDDLRSMVPELRSLAAAAGRPRPSVTVTGLAPDPEILTVLEGLDVERLILRLTPAPIDQVRRELDGHLAAVSAAGWPLTPD